MSNGQFTYSVPHPSVPGEPTPVYLVNMAQDGSFYAKPSTDLSLDKCGVTASERGLMDLPAYTRLLAPVSEPFQRRSGSHGVLVFGGGAKVKAREHRTDLSGPI